MDTITLAGTLEQKLDAIRGAGFRQVMLSARDLTSHEGGIDAAVAAVKRSGLRVTGFQVLRDFEGLSGPPARVQGRRREGDAADVRRGGLADLLLVCSSTSVHATGDFDVLAKDLAKLATLAVPFGIRVAYEALSWGRHVNEYPKAWEIVERANRSNLGLALDSFHILATKTTQDELEYVFPDRIFLVQLSDFMWQEIRSPEEKINTARHFRVFPGEGVHGDDVAALVRRLDAWATVATTASKCSTTTTLQLPVDVVAARARKAAGWLTSRIAFAADARRAAVAPPPPGV